MTTLQELAEKHCLCTREHDSPTEYSFTLTQLEALIKEVLGDPVVYIHPMDIGRFEETTRHKVSSDQVPLYSPQVRLSYQCKRCGGQMKEGIATGQTWSVGIPDFPNQTDSTGQTLSPGGPGKIVTCMKCEKCGWSVS